MKNCCDYDAIVHYEAGEFNAKYKTDLSGKLEKVDLDRSLSETEVKSFKGGKYQTFVSLEPLVLYRIYGQYQKEDFLEPGKYPSGARLGGRYASTEFAESAIDVKLRLALAPKWLNTKMFEAKIQVPKGTKLSVGIAASVTLPVGTVLPGGAEQLLLPKDWPELWVLGYRRVTSRQLQVPPNYWPEKPAEVVVGKNGLYPRLCPLCGYEQTKELSVSEQFDIIGVKGNRYTMRRKCLNPACQYHW